MRLTDLDPEFIKLTAPNGSHRTVDSIAEADGIRFLCPKCFQFNGGPIGTHSVICWEPDVPPEVQPNPGRWQLIGSGFDDLSLVAGSSSILLTGGCRWHGFITNGEVTT